MVQGVHLDSRALVAYFDQTLTLSVRLLDFLYNQSETYCQALVLVTIKSEERF
jgi:hypothetical protein